MHDGPRSPSESLASTLLGQERRACATYEKVIARMGTGGGTTVWQLGAMKQDHADSARALECFMRNELGVTENSTVVYPSLPNVPSSRNGLRQALEQLRWLELETLQMYEAALGSEHASPELREEVLLPAQYRSLRCYRRLELGVPAEFRFETSSSPALAAE